MRTDQYSLSHLSGIRYSLCHSPRRHIRTGSPMPAAIDTHRRCSLKGPRQHQPGTLLKVDRLVMCISGLQTTDPSVFIVVFLDTCTECVAKSSMRHDLRTAPRSKHKQVSQERRTRKTKEASLRPHSQSWSSGNRNRTGFEGKWKMPLRQHYNRDTPVSYSPGYWLATFTS